MKFFNRGFMQTAMKFNCNCFVIMPSVLLLDLLQHFNPPDTRDVSEKDVEMKMKEICLERSTASFEPKSVVKAVLQDVTNAKKKRRQEEVLSQRKKTPNGIHCWICFRWQVLE
jgi:hypothetical protein